MTRFLKCFGKYSDFKSLDSSHLAAAGLGFEPKFSLSESDVLPLDDPANMKLKIYNQKSTH